MSLFRRLRDRLAPPAARWVGAHPSELLPTGEDLTIVFNEVAPRYESATQAIQLAWDTLVQPDGAHA